jgi:CIC family chloride channel protein
MMALFGGVAKAPIAVMLMVAEMTGEFSMLVPAMVATSIAYLVTGDITIYESQVPVRAESPAHRGEYAFPLMTTITIGQAMRRNVVSVSPEDSIEVAEQRMVENEIRGLPVLADGRLVGIFTATDALRGRNGGSQRVEEIMTRRLQVAHPDESLHVALQRMTSYRISRLPVVDRLSPDDIVGIVSVRDVAVALDVEVRALASRTLDQRHSA